MRAHFHQISCLHNPFINIIYFPCIRIHSSCHRKINDNDTGLKIAPMKMRKSESRRWQHRWNAIIPPPYSSTMATCSHMTPIERFCLKEKLNSYIVSMLRWKVIGNVHNEKVAASDVRTKVTLNKFALLVISCKLAFILLLLEFEKIPSSFVFTPIDNKSLHTFHLGHYIHTCRLLLIWFSSAFRKFACFSWNYI